jgi:hypothetical protein
LRALSSSHYVNKGEDETINDSTPISEKVHYAQEGASLGLETTINVWVMVDYGLFFLPLHHHIHIHIYI